MKKLIKKMFVFSMFAVGIVLAAITLTTLIDGLMPKRIVVRMIHPKMTYTTVATQGVDYVCESEPIWSLFGDKKAIALVGKENMPSSLNPGDRFELRGRDPIRDSARLLDMVHVLY